MCFTFFFLIVVVFSVCLHRLQWVRVRDIYIHKYIYMAMPGLQRVLAASSGAHGARVYRKLTGTGSFFQPFLLRAVEEKREMRSHSALQLRRKFFVSAAFASAMTHARRWQSSKEATDYYTLLRVRPDASADEIKASYKKLALQYHPDRNSDPGAEEMFKNISEAYHVIGNKERRKEYDGRRAASSFSGGGSGSGFSTGYSQQSPPGYQHMSKEEADRLFRDLFGGMRVDQIFRDFEEEMRRSSMGVRQGRTPSDFAENEQAFRPFFRGGSTRIFTDAHGNRMEEREFQDSRGTTFKVRTISSENPNASTNQRVDEFYSAKAEGSRDGRFHYGNTSFNVNPRGATNDFGQAAFGVRTHGRHPFVGMMIIAAWGVVIGTFFLAVFAFFFSHPIFTLSVLFLIFLGRMRPFW
ncbi:chaperone DNAJ protein, putative [Trypanosoma cruzi marinkellei]|uniref:Chaperone DNAJ protein, putative n=1 Tax=Trypanosoma cruzi marinkellei TaxID=85056 RepID=K2M4E8_TRYCR|nr:chaperone DNAJ protein, putative [Trypanosoma cruzi marinkellei]